MLILVIIGAVSTCLSDFNANEWTMRYLKNDGYPRSRWRWK